MKDIREMSTAEIMRLRVAGAKHTLRQELCKTAELLV